MSPETTASNVSPVPEFSVTSPAYIEIPQLELPTETTPDVQPNNETQSN